MFVYIIINSIGVGVNVFQTPLTVPVIGSTTEYTITCNINVICPGCNETLIVLWNLNGNSINSTTHTESSGPYTVFGDSKFTSTLTTVGNISLSHAGLYFCYALVLNVGISRSDTTDFNVNCKLFKI